LFEENERLKIQLQKAAIENEILKATFTAPELPRSPSPLSSQGPMRYSPTDFYTKVLNEHENKTPSHRIVTIMSGERLLAVGAAWGYIIKHPPYVSSLVDVGEVSDRLKRVAKLDGQGTVFDAIVKSVSSRADLLGPEI
jgi:AP-1-like factor